MEFVQQRLESWIRDQRVMISKVSWGTIQWRMKWPWIDKNKEQVKRMQEEYERTKKHLQHLCVAIKVESISDLQDVLCCMVLSECVYKRPVTELVRAVNKFKADFGGQVVSLERVQPSGDHVSHGYLLAETSDTLFASFIGTKQYKDVMADANIFQGAIFNEEALVDSKEFENKYDQSETRNGGVENNRKTLEPNRKQFKNKPKPAAHRGFLARAKGIPALELYRLAQKKKRKLVLCGHSLGGAVAALATLAILRVIASSKENEKVLVKCITFSQPPVGNAALRDYVNGKGWHHYFKTYCIPEDLVPRILSPAYFHHYNEKPLSTVSGNEITNSPLSTKTQGVEKSKLERGKGNEGEQLVLGLGPVQNPFWRLSRLVLLEGVKRQLDKYKGNNVNHANNTSEVTNIAVASIIDDVVSAQQSLEIKEGSEGISLKLRNTDKGIQDSDTSEKLAEKINIESGSSKSWRRVPYLPSYVPFGQLYILENSSVESLSGAEYSKLTSVKSVITELRERLQSHSMKSYRSRFQKIYDLCMGDNASSFMGLDQLQQFPHLQQWLGVSVAGSVELGHIVESPVIRTATSIVPLGWSGKPGGTKNGEPLKVDIAGYGLHLCTLVQARVNGVWCDTTVESFPSTPTYSNPQDHPELQKMRVLVGPPSRQIPKHRIVTDSPLPIFPPIDNEASQIESILTPEGLSDFSIYCTNDFTTVTKEVHVRTRKVRLIGLEGAGKTFLFKAIVGQGKLSNNNYIEHLHPDCGIHEYITGGLCYSDSKGINLQELSMEISRFKDELWMGIRDLSKKTDLIVLVHNLSHAIPKFSHSSNTSEQQPALTYLLNEAKVLGIPWVLAITNKFSVSANQQRTAIDEVLQAYNASPSITGVINSFPFVMPIAGSATLSLSSMGGDSDGRVGPQKIFFAPVDLIWKSFQKKASILPVEGVPAFCKLVHRELRSHEEASFQDLAKERLMLELERERATATGALRDSRAKETALTAAAVGASLGAGLGLVLAVVMGAASALRKP